MAEEMPQLTFFDDVDDLRRFFQVTTLAYGGALASIEAGGMTLIEANQDSLANEAQAVLLGRLVVKMFQYKAERAAQLATGGPEVVAEADAELAKVWPMFEAFLEAELADAREMIEKLRADGRGALH